MVHPDYNSPQALKAFLEEHGMAMQKKFGQNFMVNPAARTSIIKHLDINEGDVIWEIGPGLGCMTEEIMAGGANLTAFEIDRGFIGFLHSFFEQQEQNGTFRIVEGDVLKNWKKEFEKVSVKDGEVLKDSFIKLSGNLPYNIAATFIAETITYGAVFERCVFTVQKEVTERICAKPSSENYSAFSVLCQWCYDVKSGIELAAGNFWPRPNVASQAVIFTRKTEREECYDPRMFVKTVHALFSSRRKTIANNIKSILPAGVTGAEVFEKCGIEPSRRAESMSVSEFIKIANCLHEISGK